MAFTDTEPDEVRARIAARIREIAERRQLPLTKLADQAEVSRTHLWAVLGGRRAPTSDVLTRLANVLRVDPIELLRKPRSSK